MKKFFVLSFGIILCLTCFCGCAEIQALNIAYADSSRMMSYSIQLDKNELDKLGIDYLTAIASLDECADEYWEQLGYSFDTSKANFSANLNSKNSHFEIKITFDRFEKYCEFFHTTAEEQSKIPDTLEEGFLFTKRILLDENANLDSIFLNIFDRAYFVDGVSTESTVLQVLVQKLSSKFGKTKAEITALLNSTEGYIGFAYANSLKIRSNADYIARVVSSAGVGNDESVGYTAHFWKYNLLGEKPKMKLYKFGLTKSNVYAWYGLGVASAVVFGVVLWIIFSIQNKRKKNQVSIYRDETFDRTLGKTNVNEPNSSQNQNSSQIEDNKEEKSG